MGKSRRKKLERRDHKSADRTSVSDSLEIYRYLEEEGHMTAWITGGRIPIRQALYYRTLEGAGGRADIEDAMHRTVVGMSLEQIQTKGSGPSPIHIAPGTNVKLAFEGCTFGGPSGVHYIRKGQISQNHPPCLILCLSTTLSRETAKAIDEKIKFCVRVVNPHRLLEVIDGQLGANGQRQPVQYTTGDNRNTFLKSNAYRGQDEYRLAWEGMSAEDVWIELPPGIAERVEIPG